MVLEAQKEPKEYAYIVNLLNYLKLAFTFNPLEIMRAQNSLKIGFSLAHQKWTKKFNDTAEVFSIWLTVLSRPGLTQRIILYPVLIML